ncbi:unnamed protein product [Vicia faba]|uniref:Uncharacterized protein n=1 Tax=Vicia faba TaxID=3906 RepID=A0AAV0Z3W4_VICFA|nr:unnamed protein product [Vicia faba]
MRREYTTLRGKRRGEEDEEALRRLSGEEALHDEASLDDTWYFCIFSSSSDFAIICFTVVPEYFLSSSLVALNCRFEMPFVYVPLDGLTNMLLP